MEAKERFKVIYSEEVLNFLDSIDPKAKRKIMSNVAKSKYVVDSELFKKLTGTNLWEFRTFFNGKKYRLLSFWDTEKDAIVVTTHGFIKKTQKTPQKEIDRAEEIRRLYFKSK